MNFDSSRAIELLRLATNDPGANFRPDQEEAIRHIVQGDGRLLVVQATGWGKSFVYFAAAKLLREAGGGPALLVSPLLALMRNQIAGATRMGVSAVTINSDNQDEWAQLEEAIRQGEIDIILISPERLANDRFRTNVLASIASTISLLVVDDAHCISDWGHDFRPHYRLIERIVKTLPSNVRLLATTATANDRVLDDLKEVLGPELTVIRGSLHRPSLKLQSIVLRTQAERLAWLAQNLVNLDGSGIVYALTIRDAEMIAAWLQSRGIDAHAYTSETGDRRVELEEALLANNVKALVATSALGMGFDKPDLAFVIHYQAPSSVVTYYQQVGRAGRSLAAAYGVVLSGTEEVEIAEYFIGSAFPSREEVDQVLGALEQEAAGLSIVDLQAKVNLSRGRIDKVLSLLSLESPAPIVRQGTKYQLTVADLSEDFWERTVRLTDIRQHELAEMQTYKSLQDGHMAFLIAALDGDPSSIVVPDLPDLPTSVSEGLVLGAVAFLKATNIPFESRKQWPSGGLPSYDVRGKISSVLQAEDGRSLARWGDAGWGGLVREGKYSARYFAEDLVEACAELVVTWNPQPFPAWVTCIPSLRHPDLVPDFARRLAKRLGLPFLAVLTKIEDRPEQKTMANSTLQALNLDGSIAIDASAILKGPVFLIDDVVDSRWTFTVAAWLLRGNGSGPVYPLALARSGFE